MGIVAVTREMGSLGTFIAQEAARRLGYELVRQDITRDAAREYEVLEANLVGSVEARPGLFETLTQSARRYQIFVASEVYEVALRDRVVILGRWSAFLLEGIGHAARVRVTAPLGLRVRRVMERLGIDERAARERIRRYEEGVRARIRQFFDVEWADPLRYDLVINTETVGVETGATQLVALASGPEFQPTPRSVQTLQDRALAARVRATLKARPETAALDVEVSAEERRIRLRGTVSADRERDAAVRVAREVEGVGEVASEVTVMRMPTR